MTALEFNHQISGLYATLELFTKKFTSAVLSRLDFSLIPLLYFFFHSFGGHTLASFKIKNGALSLSIKINQR